MKTQNIYLEHANITVSNLEKAVHFFQTAFPHFKIRGGGNVSKEWLHLGDDVTYVALNIATVTATKNEKNYSKLGVNHIGFVVDDVNEITTRLLEAGYKRDYPKEIEQFRIRDYFADADGNQFEFIQYLSNRVEEKNSFND
jgi:catechol 2,3-dioxygenase-like lactoylglutathione lyase family enzyme